MPWSRSTASSATTASPRRSCARAAITAVFTVAYVVRAVAPGKYVRPQAERRGHVLAGPLRPHRDRERGGDGGEMSDLLPPQDFAHSRASGNPGAACTAFAQRWVPAFARTQRSDSVALPSAHALSSVCSASLVLAAGAWWIAALGPAPDGKAFEFSTRVLDRDGRLLRAYATPEGRWRLPARIADVDPRLFAMLFAYEDKRFRTHPGVDPLALMRAALQLVEQRTHSLRRLDTDHAGGAASGAAQRAQLRCQAPPDRARGRDRADAEQGRDPFALSRSRALWRQYRGHPRRLARLFRQGAAAAVARRSGSARGAAAVARGAPAGSLDRRRRAPRAIACSTASPLRQRAGGRDRARQSRTGAGRAPADANAGAARGRSRGRRCGRGAGQRSTAHDRCRFAEEPGRACARAHARLPQRSAPISRSRCWSSTTRPARCARTSARRIISISGAPARSI